MVTGRLPNNLIIPGLIAGGGINRSCNRFALPVGQLWVCRNVIPSSQGYSGRGIGWIKQNTNNLSTAPIRGGAIFGGKHIYVKNGGIYRQDVGGSAETSIVSSVFNAANRVDMAKARGTGANKLYMVDGANTPRAWDGTNQAQVTAFNSTILSTITTSVKPDKIYRHRERLVFGFPSTSSFRDYVLFSKDRDADVYSASGAATDAFFEEVLPQEGEYITAFGELKRNLDPNQAADLIVFKQKKTYKGRGAVFAGGAVSQTFDLQAFDLGAINNQSVINFANSLVAMSTRGLGMLDSATVSGGIDAITYQFGLRVNDLIKDEAAKSSNFSKGFMLHSPQKQLFLAFMPQNSSVGSGLYGYGYPEIPNNYAIAYYYGVQDKDGNPTNQWVDYIDVGFAASCGWVDDNGDIYVGSYFGDVYKIFVDGATEFERNPNTPTKKAIYNSGIMTGDHSIDEDLNKAKTLKDLELMWFVDTGVTANIAVYYDGKSTGTLISRLTAGSQGLTGVYGSSKYGQAVYAFKSNASMHCAPAGIGNTVRILVEWPAEIETSPGQYVANFGSLHGLTSSAVGFGGKNFRRRR